MKKNPSGASCRCVDFLLCCTQVQLDALQPLIFFNQKTAEEGGYELSFMLVLVLRSIKEDGTRALEELSAR